MRRMIGGAVVPAAREVVRPHSQLTIDFRPGGPFVEELGLRLLEIATATFVGRLVTRRNKIIGKV